MDINVLREIVTVVSFLTFIGIVAWAVAPGNRARFEQAARLPLEEEGPSAQPSPRGREKSSDAVSRNRDIQR